MMTIKDFAEKYNQDYSLVREASFRLAEPEYYRVRDFDEQKLYVAMEETIQKKIDHHKCYLDRLTTKLTKLRKAKEEQGK